MKDTAIIALDQEKAAKLASLLDADLLPYREGVFTEVFESYRRIVAIMAMGIVIRGIAPLVKSKWEDPAVVLVTPDLRFAVPMLGGHHGANELAKELGEKGLVPVLSTATEAAGLESVEGIMNERKMDVLNRDSTKEVNAAILKGTVPLYLTNGPGMVLAGPGVSVLLRKGEYTIGVGCRKGAGRDEIISAVRQALKESGLQASSVLAYATTDKKVQEIGLIEGITSLGGNLVFLPDEEINAQDAPTPSRASILGLKGVAEPAALAISRKKELIMKRRVIGNVTVAIAR
ncbi:cobalt-precorrin 5A hydrolase [Methanomassiliicoccus luminyensis]|uniref:cobalt-precorrin 5A hydrolase n=1 Tax=Methanomassiliicoccus luminyensis TaxID=1080712 RepID=UPI00036725E3|nr:cobalt-precorrin 5A hydrolase [Methanomassiliicoccus luminyensis]